MGHRWWRGWARVGAEDIPGGPALVSPPAAMSEAKILSPSFGFMHFASEEMSQG